MLLIFDCESYIVRACVATKALQQCKTDRFIWGEYYDLRKGLEYINNIVSGFCDKFRTNNIVFVTGDANNWRKEYYPEYKSNRKDKEKHIIYPMMLEELTKAYDFVSLPNLEADDTCRIIYEDNKNYPERKVLISIDKDFRSFPCELYNPLNDTHNIITEQEANHNLMKQIIMGDKCDGYSGLTGYGEVTTEKFLNAEPRILDDVRELFREKKELKIFNRNLNLASMVSLDRYDFNTGKVKIL